MTYKQITKAKYLRKEIDTITKYYDRLITSKNSLSYRPRIHNNAIDRNMINIEKIRDKLTRKYRHLYYRLDRLRTVCNHKTPDNKSSWIFTNNPTGHKSECQICGSKRW
jgi:ribosomal protein RSM22 (predicted rRNA methylase)